MLQKLVEMAEALFDSLKCFDVGRASELLTLKIPQKKKSYLATYQSYDGVIVQHELAWLCCGKGTSATIVGINWIFL